MQKSIMNSSIAHFPATLSEVIRVLLTLSKGVVLNAISEDPGSLICATEEATRSGDASPDRDDRSINPMTPANPVRGQ
jgi:hypothetical protein